MVEKIPGLLDHVCLVCPVGLVGPQRLVDEVVIVVHQASRAHWRASRFAVGVIGPYRRNWFGFPCWNYIENEDDRDGESDEGCADVFSNKSHRNV